VGIGADAIVDVIAVIARFDADVTRIRWTADVGRRRQRFDQDEAAEGENS
jgi:hypothetical protein